MEFLGAREELFKSSSHQVSLNHIRCSELTCRSTLITSLALFAIKLNLLKFDSIAFRDFEHPSLPPEEVAHFPEMLLNILRLGCAKIWDQNLQLTSQ